MPAQLQNRFSLMRNGRLAAIDIKWEEKGSVTSRPSLERTRKYYIEFTDSASLDSNLELKNKVYHLLK